jgi:integral membrane protein
MKKFTLSTPLGRFLLVGLLEGISYLVLLCIAMPLKYMADMPEAVRIAGMVHGVLFILFVLLLIQVMIEHKWSIGKGFLAFLASIVPFGTFFLDRLLVKNESTAAK